MKLRFVVAALTVLGFAPDARAEAPRPIIVVVSPKSGPFALRVRAELESMGFRVLELGSVRRELPDGAVAVATIVEGRVSRIEIRSASDLGDTAARPVVIEAPDGDVGSIQAAERVRAFFQPLAVRSAAPEGTHEPEALPVSPTPAPTTSVPIAPAPPPSAPGASAGAPPPAATNAWVPARAFTGFSPQPLAGAPPPSGNGFAFSFSLGLSTPMDVGGTGLGALGTLAFAPVHWLRIEPFVAVPIVPTSIQKRGGSADFYTGMVGIEVNFALYEGAIVDLFGGGGAAGVWLRATGHADAGYVGRTDDAFSFAPLVDLMARLRFSKTFSLVPRTTVGVSLPAPAIQFDQSQVGRWGLPWGGFGLSLEAAIIR